MTDEIKGATEVPDPGAASRTVITDEDAAGLKNDDVTSAVVGDADVHDPPVRSALPDAPVADAVGVGQGAHTPPDPAAFGADGRPLAESSTAFVSGDRAETSDEPGATNPDDVGAVPTRAEPLDGPATEVVGSDAAPSESSAVDDEPTGNGVVPEDTSDADPAELAESHSGDELRAAAAERELATSGTKSELAERIVAYDRET